MELERENLAEELSRTDLTPEQETTLAERHLDVQLEQRDLNTMTTKELVNASREAIVRRLAGDMVR